MVIQNYSNKERSGVNNRKITVHGQVCQSRTYFPRQAHTVDQDHGQREKDIAFPMRRGRMLHGGPGSYRSTMESPSCG